MADTATTEDTPEETKPDPAAELRAAVAAEGVRMRAEMAGQFDEERERLKSTNAAIKEEKTAVQDKRKAAEARVAVLELAEKATKDGHDPTEFAAAVEAAAAEKHEAHRTEWAEADTAKDTKLTKTEAELEAAKAASHRAFVGLSFVEAMLGDRRIVHEGHMGTLIDQILHHVHLADVNGIKMPRLKFASGGWVPGSGPDKLMTLEEYTGLQLAGKEVPGLPKIGIFLIDKGSGADVREVQKDVAGLNWGTMTEDQKMKMHREDGSRAQQLILDHSKHLATGGSQSAQPN